MNIGQDYWDIQCPIVLSSFFNISRLKKGEQRGKFDNQGNGIEIKGGLSTGYPVTGYSGFRLVLFCFSGLSLKLLSGIHMHGINIRW